MNGMADLNENPFTCWIALADSFSRGVSVIREPDSAAWDGRGDRDDFVEVSGEHSGRMLSHSRSIEFFLKQRMPVI